MDREIEVWQLEKFLRHSISHLSAGQFKRVLLATCFSKASSLFLLDEPTAGLDERFIPILQNQLQERMDMGAMLMVATHQPEVFCGDKWSSLTLEATA